MSKQTRDKADALLEELRSSPRVPNQKLAELAAREETLLVSLILKDQEIMTNAVESGLSPHCFQNDIPRRLFTMAAEHFDRFHQLLTRPAMESVLAAKATPEDAAFLQGQYDSVHSEIVKSGEYRMLKENIEARFVQRQAYHTCRKFAERLLSATIDQKMLVAELQNAVGEITTFGDMASFIQTSTLYDQLGKLMIELEDRQKDPTKYWGIMSGYKEIDDDYHGFVKRRYMVITATEGGGKSTMMFNFARNFAIGGSNVVYVTIESGNDDVARRLLTIHSGVSYNRIMAGGTDTETGLCPHIMKELEAAKNDLCGGTAQRVHLIQVLEQTPLDVIFRRINRRRAYAPVDVVFVDYLQVIGREKSYGERVDQEIAFVSSKLRAWGRANNVLTCTANQIKTAKSAKLQEAKSDDDLMIVKADTSGTKEIAGAADYMFGVFIPMTKDRLVLYSTKTRMGRDTQKYVLTYDPESGRIESSGEYGDADQVAAELRNQAKRKAIKEGKPLQESLPVAAEDETEHGGGTAKKIPTSNVDIEKLQKEPERIVPIVDPLPAVEEADMEESP